jgi:septal ring factor EnvC (AmiA/AmiB activator)
MALLNGSTSRKPKRKPGLVAPAASVPSSLPDLDSSKRIESLEKELAEAKASGESSKQEIADLKAQLQAAKETATPSQQSATTTQPGPTTTHERHTGKSFFGYPS